MGSIRVRWIRWPFLMSFQLLVMPGSESLTIVLELLELIVDLKKKTTVCRSGSSPEIPAVIFSSPWCPMMRTTLPSCGRASLLSLIRVFWYFEYKLVIHSWDFSCKSGISFLIKIFVSCPMHIYICTTHRQFPHSTFREFFSQVPTLPARCWLRPLRPP